MKSIYSCLSFLSWEKEKPRPIKVTKCPEWLRYLESGNSNSKLYLYLLRNLYCESVAFDFQFSQLLPLEVLYQHIREVMFVAADPQCRNREILRLYLTEQCEADASLSLSIFYFCQLNWDEKTKRDSNLFLQKLRVLSLPRVQSALSSISSDSSILCTLFNNSISFFNTLFSFSSYLYTIPPSQRYSMFTEQCTAINKMTLSQCHGIWLPLHHGFLITRIVTEDSKVLSTKARCPCVFQFDVIGSGRKTRIKKEKTVLDVFHPPYSNSKLTFFSWICSFFRLAEKTPSLDIDLFPSKAETEDSVIVVSENQDTFPFEKYRVIVKTRDTMRQEEMAAHIIAEIDSILKADKIPSILQCYEVLAFSDHDGMIDYLDGFLSLHEIKKTINELGFDSLGVW